ncbi:MAG: hypothetical protein IPM59_10215 [Chloracidobacterium sp.]|nr:hypothetical protein [Chloracidobacterium sp.]
MKGKFLALCLDNDGYKASLEVGKVYPVIRDKAAEKEGYLRVIDESGEDYAFAADRFHMVELPLKVKRTLAAHAAVFASLA